MKEGLPGRLWESQAHGGIGRTILPRWALAAPVQRDFWELGALPSCLTSRVMLVFTFSSVNIQVNAAWKDHQSSNHRTCGKVQAAPHWAATACSNQLRLSLPDMQGCPFSWLHAQFCIPDSPTRGFLQPGEFTPHHQCRSLGASLNLRSSRVCGCLKGAEVIWACFH